MIKKLAALLLFCNAANAQQVFNGPNNGTVPFTGIFDQSSSVAWFPPVVMLDPAGSCTPSPLKANAVLSLASGNLFSCLPSGQWHAMTGAGVPSWNGRIGAVVPQTGDYTASMVVNAVDQTIAYGNPNFIANLAASKITGQLLVGNLPFTPLNVASNLGDLASPTTARTNLGLGTAATMNSTSFLTSTTPLIQTIDNAATPLPQRPTVNFGGSGVTCVDNAGALRTDCTITSGSGGVADPGANALMFRSALNVSRPAVAGTDFQAPLGFTPANTASNLSDLSSATTARSNLGLGTAATQNSTAFLQGSNNLSDIVTPATARANLGLGSAATFNSTSFQAALGFTPANVASNLSDLANTATARTNLGLGSAATQSSSSFLASSTPIYQTVANSGTPLTQRPTVNFAGSGVTCTDNSGSSRTDCTITGGGGGGTASKTTTVTFGATPTFTASSTATDNFILTLTGNVTSSTLAAATSGENINFSICQDATGSRTFTWPTNVLSPPTVYSGAGICTNIVTRYDGTNANIIAPVALTGVGSNLIQIPGSTSGATVLQAAAAAAGTITLPAATDTLVGKATTDVLTNKSIAASEINSGTLAYAQGGTASASFTGQQGAGVKIQASTGATTTNDCVKFDASGNTVDNGAGCGANTPATSAFLKGTGSANGVTAATAQDVATTVGSTAVVCSGSAVVNDSSTILAALALSPNGRVFIPSSPICYANIGMLSGQALIGVPNKSTIRAFDTTSPIINTSTGTLAAPVHDVLIDGLILDGNNGTFGTTGQGIIYTKYAKNFTVRNTVITSTTGQNTSSGWTCLDSQCHGENDEISNVAKHGMFTAEDGACQVPNGSNTSPQSTQGGASTFTGMRIHDIGWPSNSNSQGDGWLVGDYFGLYATQLITSTSYTPSYCDMFETNFYQTVSASTFNLVKPSSVVAAGAGQQGFIGTPGGWGTRFLVTAPSTVTLTPAAPLSCTVTAASITSNVATFTCPNTFVPGDFVTTAGFTPSVFNVTKQPITFTSSSLFKVAITNANTSTTVQGTTSVPIYVNGTASGTVAYSLGQGATVYTPDGVQYFTSLLDNSNPNASVTLPSSDCGTDYAPTVVTGNPTSNITYTLPTATSSTGPLACGFGSSIIITNASTTNTITVAGTGVTIPVATTNSPKVTNCFSDGTGWQCGGSTFGFHPVRDHWLPIYISGGAIWNVGNNGTQNGSIGNGLHASNTSGLIADGISIHDTTYSGFRNSSSSFNTLTHAKIQNTPDNCVYVEYHSNGVRIDGNDLSNCGDGANFDNWDPNLSNTYHGPGGENTFVNNHVTNVMFFGVHAEDPTLIEGNVFNHAGIAGIQIGHGNHHSQTRVINNHFKDDLISGTTASAGLGFTLCGICIEIGYPVSFGHVVSGNTFEPNTFNYGPNATGTLVPIAATNFGNLYGNGNLQPNTTITNQWLPFAMLGTPDNGSSVYVPDGFPGGTCTGSGTGTQAFRVGGTWNCGQQPDIYFTPTVTAGAATVVPTTSVTQSFPAANLTAATTITFPSGTWTGERVCLYVHQGGTGFAVTLSGPTRSTGSISASASARTRGCFTWTQDGNVWAQEAPWVSY